MTFLLGLTGSIGMGKSTTAKLFAEAGCAVWDADAAVHRLYEPGGAAVAPIGAVFPQAVDEGGVSRDRLRGIIAVDAGALQKIEAIVHPLVAQDRARFIAQSDAEIVVLDMPLLFETGGDAAVNAVVCVTIPAELQRKRVLERGTMTAEQFETIKAKQMPDTEKRQRADYVIVTDTVEHARAQVQSVLADFKKRMQDA
jgi:dephospho-CoA kinase